MSFEITGKLHKKFDTEQKTATFSTREFVIYTEQEQYPQYIKFQLTQDRCSLIDALEEGKPTKVYFDLRGREWQGKYFTNLNAWKVEQVASNDGTPSGISSNDTTGTSDTPFPTLSDAPSTSEGDEFEDDLPF